jgi:hypothetical protein
MNNDYELDELIKDIAVKHGIAVGRDDPILILHTLNQRLLQNNQKAQQALLEHYQSELEGMSLRWSTDAKAQAERLLNASLDVSKSAMERMLQSTAKETGTAIKAEVDVSLARFRCSMMSAHRIGLMNITAACITLLTTILLWIVVRG